MVVREMGKRYMGLGKNGMEGSWMDAFAWDRKRRCMDAERGCMICWKSVCDLAEPRPSGHRYLGGAVTD